MNPGIECIWVRHRRTGLRDYRRDLGGLFLLDSRLGVCAVYCNATYQLCA
jgi:hypothetical protein